MSARLSARKVSAVGAERLRPILTRTGVDRAVRSLERRYGPEFARLQVGDMSECDKNIVVNAILRIAKARYGLGCKAFRSADIDEYDLVDGIPVRWMTDTEIIAVCKLASILGERS